MRLKIIDDHLYTAIEEERFPSGEMNSEINTIDAMYKFADTSMESLSDLEIVQDLLKNHTVGDADEYTMKVAAASMKNSYKRLGVDLNMPSLSKEAFDNDGLRRLEFDMSIESVMGAVRNGWNAIIEFFKQIWSKIKELWKTYTNALNHLKMLVKNARKKLLSYKNVEDITDTFTDKSISKALKIGNELGVDKQIENCIREFQHIDVAKQDMIKDINKIQEAAESKDTEKQTQAALDLRATMNKIGGFIKSKSEDKGNELDIKDDQRLLGNGVVIIYIDGENKNISIDVEKIMYNEDVTDFDLPVASKPDINKYLSSIINLINRIEQARNKSDTESKTILNTLDRFAKKNKKLPDSVTDKNGKTTTIKKPNTNTNQANNNQNGNQNATEDNNNPEDNNSNDGANLPDSKLDSGDTKDIKGNKDLDKENIKLIKELVKVNGKLTYLPTKIMIDGCYKLISYIEKSLVYYSGTTK